MMSAEEPCPEQTMGTGPSPTLAGVLEPAVLPAKELLREAERGVGEHFRNLVAANLAKPVSGDGTATVDGLDEKDWVGGYAGTELLLIRRSAFRTPIEPKGNYIRLPIDAATLYKHLGKETLGVGVGPETPMDEAKMQKPLGAMGPLQPEGPGVNWEHWFRLFEEHATQKSVPLEQWPDLLKWQTSPAMRKVITAKVGACLREHAIPPRLVYGTVRALLIGGPNGKYGPGPILKGSQKSLQERGELEI